MVRKIVKPRKEKPAYMQVDLEAFARVFHFPKKQETEQKNDTRNRR